MDNSNSKVSKHANERMHETIGIPKKSCQRLANIALEKGLQHSEAQGSLNRYITALYFEYETANQIRLYGDKVYLFKGTTLITVKNVPKKYLNTIKHLQSKKKENE